MIAALARVVTRHWASLLALWIAAVVLRDVALRGAAEVGVHLPFLGGLLVSVAMLVRMAAFVAMLLVVRPELEHVPQEDRRDGGFAVSLVRATIPFAAFYLASGLLQQDWKSYVELAGARMLSLGLDDPPVLQVMGLTWPAAAVVVVCLALRLAWGRWRDRLPWFTGVAALIVEVLWVYLTAFMVDDALGATWEWLSTRQVAVWVDGVRLWLADVAAPLALLWQGIEPAAEAVLNVVIVPLSWLLTAATVYGGSLVSSAERARRSGRRPPRIRLSDTARAAVGGAARVASDHVETVRGAFSLIPRTGPLLIGGYLLLFAVIGLLEPALFYGITRLIGPQSRSSAEEAFLPTLVLIPSMVVTPMLVILVALCCNAAFQRVARAQARSATSDESGSESVRVEQH